MPYTFTNQAKDKKSDEYTNDFKHTALFNPNENDSLERISLLRSAIKNDLPEAVDALLKYPGIKINDQDPHTRSSALHDACSQKKLPFIKQLILADASFTITQSGKTPLQLLSLKDDRAMLEELLFFACENNRFDLIKYLIKTINVNPNCVNEENKTPLHTLCLKTNTNSSLAILKWFITENKGDFQIKDNHQKFPLDLIANQKILEQIFLHSCQINKSYQLKKIIIRQMFDKKINLNCTDDQGRTALHFAAESGDEELVNILLSNPQIDATKQTTKSGNTPLHTAIFQTHLLVVQAFFTKAINIFHTINEYLIRNHETIDDTAALKALREQDISAYQTLTSAINTYKLEQATSQCSDIALLNKYIRNKSILNILNNDGFTPMMMALEGFSANFSINFSADKEENIIQIIKLFDSCKEFDAADEISNKLTYKKNSYLHLICINKIPLSIIKLLLSKLENNTICNSKNQEEMAPIHLAVEYYEMIPVLFNKGINYHILNKEKSTFLHLIAHKNHYEPLKIAIQALRDKLSDENAVRHELTNLIKMKDNQGRNVITIAAEKTDSEFLSLLLDNMEEQTRSEIINTPDNDGNTALHKMLKSIGNNTSQKKLECYILLLEYGGNVTLINSSQETPSDLAKPYNKDLMRIKREMEIKKRHQHYNNVTKNNENSGKLTHTIATHDNEKRDKSPTDSPDALPAINIQGERLADPPIDSSRSDQNMIPKSGEDPFKQLHVYGKNNLYNLADKDMSGMKTKISAIKNYLSNTWLIKHFSKHKTKYKIGALILYTVGFFGLCAFSTFFPPAMPVIPIYLTVGKVLGACHLTTPLIPVIGKVVSMSLPIIVAAVCTGAYFFVKGANWLFTQAIPKLLSQRSKNEKEDSSTTQTEINSNTYEIVPTFAPDHEPHHASSLGSGNKADNIKIAGSISDDLDKSSQSSSQWIKTLKNCVAPISYFFTHSCCGADIEPDSHQAISQTSDARTPTIKI